MVIGNNVIYNSEPINLKENIRYELLKCLESGTVPTFLLSYANTSALKGTEYTAYFSVDYEILKKDILESYKYVENVFSKTGGAVLTGHKIIASNVTVSTYDNGISVYVNKSENDFISEGVVIPAMDYVIKE